MELDTNEIEQVFSCDDISAVASRAQVLALYGLVIVEKFGDGGVFVLFGLELQLEVFDAQFIMFLLNPFDGFSDEQPGFLDNPVSSRSASVFPAALCALAIHDAGRIDTFRGKSYLCPPDSDSAIQRDCIRLFFGSALSCPEQN